MTRRTACGTTRPTKPTLPATVTATAVAKAASACSASVTPRTGTPRLAAVSVAARQQRRVAREEHARRTSTHDERQQARRSPCARAGQIADQPEQHAAHLRVGRDGEHQHDQRAPSGRDDDAGQQQSRRRPRAAAARQTEHEQRRDQCAGERRGCHERGGAGEQRRQRAAGGAARTGRARTDRRADCAAAPASSCRRAPAGRRRRMRQSRAAGAIRARRRLPAIVVAGRTARAPPRATPMSTLPDRQRERERRQRQQRERGEDGPAGKAMQGDGRGGYTRQIMTAAYNFSRASGRSGMNKAFTRENEDDDDDDDAPEAASPLPAGSKNYMTPGGLRAAEGRARPSRRPASGRNWSRRSPGRPATATARKTATTSTARSACAKSTGASASSIKRLDAAEVVDPAVAARRRRRRSRLLRRDGRPCATRRARRAR